MNKNIIILLIIAALICAARGLIWPYYISGNCMDPAVKDGSYVFLSRIVPYLRAYKINDIVGFEYEGKPWIARIVALENEIIQVTAGAIRINGEILHDLVQRNWSEWKYGTYGIDEPLRVPSGHVYVLSDDLSAHHDDSRVFGPISKKTILGLVWLLS